MSYFFRNNIDFAFIQAVREVFISTEFRAIITSMESKRFELNPAIPQLTDVFAYRVELSKSEADIFAIFSAETASFDATQKTNVEQALMAVQYSSGSIASRYYSVFIGYLRLYGFSETTIMSIQRNLYSSAFVNFIIKMEFFAYFRSMGWLQFGSANYNTQYDLLWNNWAAIRNLKIINTAALQAIDANFDINIDVDVDFEVTFVAPAYATLTPNVFQGCVMDFFKAQFDAGLISLESLNIINRQVFTMGSGFNIGQTQVYMRNTILGWFSGAELTAIRDFTYNVKFTSLTFIIEILAQLEAQVGVDFSYDQFNAAVGAYKVQWDIVTFDFDYFKTILGAFTLPQAVFDLVAIDSVWQTFRWSLMLSFRGAQEVIFSFFKVLNLKDEFMFGGLYDLIASFKIEINRGFGYYIRLILIEKEFTWDATQKMTLYSEMYSMVSKNTAFMTAYGDFANSGFVSYRKLLTLLSIDVSIPGDQPQFLIFGGQQMAVAEAAFSQFGEITDQNDWAVIMGYLINFDIDLSADIFSSYMTFHRAYMIEYYSSMSSFMYYKFQSMTLSESFKFIMFNLKFASTGAVLEMEGPWSLYIGQYFIFDGFYQNGRLLFDQQELENHYNLVAGTFDGFFNFGYTAKWSFVNYFNVIFGIDLSAEFDAYDFSLFNGFNVYKQLDVEMLKSKVVGVNLASGMTIDDYFDFGGMFHEMVYKWSILYSFPKFTIVDYTAVSGFSKFNIGYALSTDNWDATAFNAYWTSLTSVSFVQTNVVSLNQIFVTAELGDCLDETGTIAECFDDQLYTSKPTKSWDFSCRSTTSFGCDLDFSAVTFYAPIECNTDACPYWTQTDNYEACPVTCYDKDGSAPTQFRVRECTNKNLWTGVNDNLIAARCDDTVALETRECPDTYWCPAWSEYSDYGECVLDVCIDGETTTSGKQSRTRTCSEKSSGVFWAIGEVDECESGDEVAEETCLNGIPCKYANIGEWTTGQSNTVFEVEPVDLEKQCKDQATCRLSDSISYSYTAVRECIDGAAGSPNCLATTDGYLETRTWDCLSSTGAYDYRPDLCPTPVVLTVVIRFTISISINLPRGTIPVAGYSSNSISFDSSNSAMVMYSTYLVGTSSNMYGAVTGGLSSSQSLVSITIVSFVRVRVRSRSRRSLSRFERKVQGLRKRRALDQEDFELEMMSQFNRWRRSDDDITVSIGEEFASGDGSGEGSGEGSGMITTTAASVTETTTAAAVSEASYEKAEIFYDVNICTQLDFATYSDSSNAIWDDLTTMIEDANKTADWPNDSTLDDVEVSSVTEDSDTGKACAVVDFTFTAYELSSETARKRREVDDSFFAVVAADIEDVLEEVIEEAAAQGDGTILDPALNITDDDISEPDVTTEDEDPVYDVSAELETAYDETFTAETDDESTCDDPADLTGMEGVSAEAQAILACEVAASSDADSIGANATQALMELDEISAANPDGITATVSNDAIEVFEPSTEVTTEEPITFTMIDDIINQTEIVTTNFEITTESTFSECNNVITNNYCNLYLTKGYASLADCISAICYCPSLVALYETVDSCIQNYTNRDDVSSGDFDVVPGDFSGDLYFSGDFGDISSGDFDDSTTPLFEQVSNFI